MRLAQVHTVSEPAMMVTAGMISVIILVKERKAIYSRKCEGVRDNMWSRKARAGANPAANSSAR